jgi:hypothetical protein
VNNKILIISAYPFNNKTAGQVNTNSIIEGLKKDGYEIDAVCFSFPEHVSQKINRFSYYKCIGRNRIQSYLYTALFFFLFPLYTRRLSLRVIYFLIKNQYRYKYIFLDYAQVFIYSLFIKNKNKIILNVQDVNMLKYHRAYKKKPLLFFIKSQLIYTEAFFFKKANFINVVSLKDKKLIKYFYKKDAVAVLPKDIFLKDLCCDNINTNYDQFLFIGAWNRHENTDGLVWFIKEVHPLLDKKYSFVIAGSNLPDHVKQNLPANFFAAGFVEDLDNLIKQSSAVISPLFLGAGIKFKVLDAFANGCRVIGTPVAFESISVNVPQAYFVCSKPADFVNAINFCSTHTADCKSIVAEFRLFLDKFETASNLIASDYFKK